MLNQTVLVGRIVDKLISKESRAIIKIAIPRSFKNKDGDYDTDFISCILWNGVAESTVEYCKKGDLIGIKGRLQNNEERIEVVAEKVTFLSNTKG